MKKQQTRIESSKTRSYKDFNPRDFETSFDNSIILGQDDFALAVQELEKELTRTLDELAPLQDRRKKKQPSRPWYSASYTKGTKKNSHTTEVDNPINGRHLLGSAIGTLEC